MRQIFYKNIISRGDNKLYLLLWGGGGAIIRWPATTREYTVYLIVWCLVSFLGCNYSYRIYGEYTVY